MANSSSEGETDTLPERPARIQPYQFEPARSLCIVIPGVVCELLQFAATQQAGIVNFFVDHSHTQFTEESKMATALTPQTDVTSGKSRD